MQFEIYIFMKSPGRRTDVVSRLTTSIEWSVMSIVHSTDKKLTRSRLDVACDLINNDSIRVRLLRHQKLE